MANAQNYIHFDVKKISLAYTLNVKQESFGYSAHIPAFDIFYYTKTKEEAKSTAKDSIKSFFDFWLNHEGWESCVNQLSKLGFEMTNSDGGSRPAQADAISTLHYKIPEPEITVFNERGEIYG